MAGSGAVGSAESLSGRAWFRRRSWVIGAAAVAVVAVTVTVVVVVSGRLSLDRVLTGRYDGPPPESGAGRYVLIEPSRDDTAYYASSGPGPALSVAAFRAGAAEPTWTTSIKQDRSPVLAFVPGILLVTFLECSRQCETAFAFDAATGQQLWTTRIPVSGVIASTDRLVVFGLVAKDGTLTYTAGAVALDARTGTELWRIEHDGKGRIDNVPGSAQLVYYENRLALSRIDITTGKPVRKADLAATMSAVDHADMSVVGDAVLLLAESGPSVNSDLEGLVFGLDDLSLRWRQPGRTTALAPGLFYSGSREHGRRVLDAGGRELWRPNDEVQVVSTEASWRYLTDFGDSKRDPDRYTYVELATGRELGNDTYDRILSEPGGVLQVVSGTRTSMRLRYLEMPSGSDTDLGQIEALRETCDTAHGLLACFDADGHPGLWRYR
jgi:PQQ-like domain